MKTRLCEKLGVDFPLAAFSHCRDVVAAVSGAGGLGVLGVAGSDPRKLEEDLRWLEGELKGRAYGVDVIVPMKVEGKGKPVTAEGLGEGMRREHWDFAAGVLEAHDVGSEGLERVGEGSVRYATNLQEGAKEMLEVAFGAGSVGLVANALGVPPVWMVEMAKERGVSVAALVGTKEHALRQVSAGVDVLVAAGGEAGGHCGEVSTMVLTPEVCRAMEDGGYEAEVLAAGGIVCGEQMAAAMAMGASGVWTGSVWLTTTESDLGEVMKGKLLEAGSGDTIRSRSRTGKPSRQLRSLWTEAWEGGNAPDPLPMPLQSLVSERALSRVGRLAERGHEGARELATYWVGQGVGLMDKEKSARRVVEEFREDFVRAYGRLEDLTR